MKLILSVFFALLLFAVAAFAEENPDDFIDQDWVTMEQKPIPEISSEDETSTPLTPPAEYKTYTEPSRPELRNQRPRPPRSNVRRPLPPSASPSENFHVGDGDQAYRKGYAAYRAKRYREAVHWFLRGADLGDVRCQYTLGNMFEFGKVVRKNYVRAAVMYKVASENGSEQASVRLAKLKAKMDSAQKQRASRLLKEKNRSLLIRNL